MAQRCSFCGSSQESSARRCSVCGTHVGGSTHLLKSTARLAFVLVGAGLIGTHALGVLQPLLDSRAVVSATAIGAVLAGAIFVVIGLRWR